jgi:hypothetical protein
MSLEPDDPRCRRGECTRSLIHIALPACAPGGRMYWGLFGYWCEDSTLSGTRPIDCTSGSGQPVGTWNNGSMTPEQLCTQPGSVAVYGRTGL